MSNLAAMSVIHIRKQTSAAVIFKPDQVESVVPLPAIFCNVSMSQSSLILMVHNIIEDYIRTDQFGGESV